MTEDRLIVQGLRLLDGEYPCNPFRLTDLVSTDSLTSREQHRLRLLTGLRGGELLENALALDAGLMVGLVLVVLGRSGKTPTNDDLIWNTRIVYATSDDAAGAVEGPALVWLVHPRVAEEDGEGDVGPPLEEPTPTPNTGGSSASTSENSENAPRRIGLLPSGMSSTSDQQTSAI